MDLEPLIFANGDAFFQQLSKDYITHDKGLFIVSPSGAGKTYYYNKQTEKHWIDGDMLWCDAGAQPPPDTAWWNKGIDVIHRVEQRCDVVTAEACDRGFWILGSVNFWYQPDAIVIPPWDTLMSQLKLRQDTNYDGGLTPEHADQLREHIATIELWHTEHGVPKFESITDAIAALTS